MKLIPSALICIIFFFLLAALGLSCCMQAFSSWGEWGLLSSCARASHCYDSSCCRAQGLGAWASVVVAPWLSSRFSQALEYRLISCGLWAQLLHGMWIFLDQGPISCPYTGRRILNHWTTRKVLYNFNEINARQSCWYSAQFR